MKRTTFAIFTAALFLVSAGALQAEANSSAASKNVEANQVKETSLVSAKTYANPFMEIVLDAVVTRPDGRQLRVPAFWAGGNDWKFRYASEQAGKHSWKTECNDAANTGLHGVTGTIAVVPSTSDNPLFKHGPVRVAADKRHFEHTDGTPFLWLGDTWWKCLCKRMTWEGFQELTADRKAKGFNVVQIVCGPYPDEKTMEERWGNEGGKPYNKLDFSEMNPEYFNYADRRIRHLVENGIVPAIVGGWGRPQGGGIPTLVQIGLDGYKRHWRNLIARYGAYPSVWIVGGEASERHGPWGDLTKYVHEIDPYHHLLVYHAPGHPRSEIKSNNELFDFDMVAVAHDNFVGAQQTLDYIKVALSESPAKPIICGEACYEGHMQNNFQDLQRHMFWSFMLSGCAGHTYGAAGIWHAGVEGDAGHTGIKGQEYDFTTWKEGMNYPGATQVGLARKLLEQYPWQKFEPHPEWAPGCFAAGIPGGTRIIYRPKKGLYDWSGFTVNNLVPGVPYTTFFFDPASGRRFDKGIVTPTSTSWKTPNVPSPQDWVLVMEAPGMGAPVILPGATAGKAYTGRLLPEGAVFANRTGPGWLTIHPDGRISGTPGEDDAGVNAWIVSVTKAGSPPAMIQLQITVAGLPGVHFSEKFNRYSGDQNKTQDQSGLKVAHTGNVAGWTSAGAGAMHAVDRANPAGQANPSDWAILIYQDNVITSKAVAANVAGTSYRVNCELSATAYNESSQATQAGDALLIEVLRADNSVLATTTKAPGAWTGKMTFTPASFDYKGDGSGDLRLRIGPAGAGKSGRFHGAIDNITVREMK